ncbi:MAG: hypothetical protein RI567_05010 [Marinobacter sp.]|nr:hypothetical protein [Marinobacter sp.]
MRLSMKISMAMAVVLLIAMVVVNQPLQTSAAPQGMISFQLAGSAEQTHAIIRSWRSDNLPLAKLALWLDFLFVITYLAALLQLTRHFTRDRPGVRERMIARGVRALFIIAGLSDVIENIVLLNNFSPATDSLSLAAAILALLKYTGFVLGVAGLVIIRAARRHPLGHST